jgi:chorismate mutase
MPLTTGLVGMLRTRTELAEEIAAQKADFALVFDSMQELAVLENAANAVMASTIPQTGTTSVPNQLAADC